MKTFILFVLIILLNGCSVLLPNVSKKSNKQLHQKTWEVINTAEIKEQLR